MPQYDEIIDNEPFSLYNEYPIETALDVPREELDLNAIQYHDFPSSFPSNTYPFDAFLFFKEVVHEPKVPDGECDWHWFPFDVDFSQVYYRKV